MAGLRMTGHALPQSSGEFHQYPLRLKEARPQPQSSNVGFNFQRPDDIVQFEPFIFLNFYKPPNAFHSLC